VDDRLYRSPTDRVIAGVAGGIAAWARIDPSIVRVAWVLLAIFSGGIFVLIYIVMMIVVPLAPEGWAPAQRHQATPGGDRVPGWGSQPGGWTPGTSGADGAAGAGPGPGAWPQGVPGAAPGPAAGTGPGPGGPSQPSASWTASGGSVSDSVATARGARMAAGAVLIVVGLWLLLGSYLEIDWNLLWPLLVIAAGAILIVAALRRRDR
jgi:phage shock protein C